MLFEYRYFGSSAVAASPTSTGMSFAPDVRRDPTFLRATLRQKLPFRECISALHDVVVSDLRFKPRDKSAYLAWRAQQDAIDWTEVATLRKDTKAQLDAAMAELRQLRAKQSGRWGPFERAKKEFFTWLYKKNVDAWVVLDPVITVHPDEVAFECFSQDESSYGRLACSHEVFATLGEHAFGTTNVDYSQSLYDEFQKIRDYKETTLTIDPRGFQVQTGADEQYREVKIDLPDTWVRGFLQVGAAMTLPGAVRFRLHPMDVHNLCFVLRRNKEKGGPRSLRFFLEPGKPVRVRFEPFGIEQTYARSVYTGDKAAEIRVWGRRRLLTLERLVPVARGFEVVLLGTGMPSFWIADCGDLSYTLGLSGWTANDWSQSGNFDLLAPRGDVDSTTMAAVWAAMSTSWLLTTKQLSDAVQRDVGTVESAMVQFAQAGRAMYDLRRGVWRKRELSRDPLDMSKLRFSNDREEEAATLVQRKGVALRADDLGDGLVRLTGRIGKDRAWLVLDADRRLKQGECTCQFHFQNKLRKGPCAHLLAIRLAHERRLGEMLTVNEEQHVRGAPPPAPRPGATTARPGLHVVGGTATRSPPPRGDEAQRFVDLLLENGRVELRPGFRDALAFQVANVFQASRDPAQRAELLMQKLERLSFVEEVFCDTEDLETLFRAWDES